MDIRYLEEFLILAEELNFSVAAEKAFTTQSTLSRHIKSLEKELGDELFHRSTRSMELSPFGQYYLPYAQGLVTAYQRSEKKRQEYIVRNSRTVRIGVINNIHLFEIDKRMQMSQEALPDALLDIVEAPSNRLQDLFQEGRLSIVTYIAPDKEPLPFPYMPFVRAQAYAYLDRSNPLNKLDELSVENLSQESIVLALNNTTFPRLCEDYFRAELGYSREFLYGSAEGAIMNAQLGSTIAIMPEEALPDPLPAHMSAKPLSPAFYYTYGLIYQSTGLNDMEKALLKYAKEEFGLKE